jgi:pyruvate,water dikinase
MEADELGWLDVEDRIRDRRMEHIRLSKMVPPKTIGVKLMERDETKERIETVGDALTGQPASPGDYEGVAHVILDPSIDIELKPGEILVAPYTDPAWTPLFLTAGAAVVEVGSYLSHAGTVAREFGMPCVVDVPDCTARIHSGVRLNVDGDRGIVRILKGEGGESE